MQPCIVRRMRSGHASGPVTLREPFHRTFHIQWKMCSVDDDKQLMMINMSMAWDSVAEVRLSTGLLFIPKVIVYIIMEKHSKIISTVANSRFVHQSSLEILHHVNCVPCPHGMARSLVVHGNSTFGKKLQIHWTKSRGQPTRGGIHCKQQFVTMTTRLAGTCEPSRSTKCGYLTSRGNISLWRITSNLNTNIYITDWR
jgi:hypothetical protein